MELIVMDTKSFTNTGITRLFAKLDFIQIC